MRVKNLKPCAVVLNGALVIAPLATVEVDGRDKGALDLIASGVLEKVTAEKPAPEAEKDAAEDPPEAEDDALEVKKPAPGAGK